MLLSRRWGPPRRAAAPGWMRGGGGVVWRRGGGVFRARLARTGDLGAERGLAFDGDVLREALERLRADAFDLQQVAGLLVRTVLGAVGDDALGALGADAREQRELRGVRGVDVHDALRRSHRRRVIGEGRRRHRGDDESKSNDLKGLPHWVFSPFLSFVF